MIFAFLIIILYHYLILYGICLSSTLHHVLGGSSWEYLRNTETIFFFWEEKPMEYEK